VEVKRPSPEETDPKIDDEAQKGWCGVGSRRTTAVNVYIAKIKFGLKGLRAAEVSSVVES